MTLEELLEKARPIAHRMAELQMESAREGTRLAALITAQREGAEESERAPANWLTAIATLAGAEIAGADAERAAQTVASALGVTDLHDTPRALAVPPLQRIELMLIQRLQAHVEGN